MAGSGRDLFRAEACLTVFGSETCDTNLGKFYSKIGLVDATADKFSEQHGIKINDEDIKRESDKNKNITKLNKYNKRTKLRPVGEILGNRFSHRVQLIVIH